MKNFVQSGVNVTVDATANTLSGQGVIIGSIFGIAAGDAKIGEPLDLVTEGVFELMRVKIQNPIVGNPAYFDEATGLVTTDDTKPVIGWLTAVNEATANVRLIPSV